jgi:hypothetical protein
MKITKESLENCNKANILALEDIISQGANAIIKLNLAEGDRTHRLEQSDIERAKRTIINLSKPVTYNDLNNLWRLI